MDACVQTVHTNTQQLSNKYRFKISIVKVGVFRKLSHRHLSEEDLPFVIREMGGLESKFNGLLVDGRNEEAETMWKENPDLQSRFNPNTQIKFSPTRDTPLHCTARHEMKVGGA